MSATHQTVGESSPKLAPTNKSTVKPENRMGPMIKLDVKTRRGNFHPEVIERVRQNQETPFQKLGNPREPHNGHAICVGYGPTIATVSAKNKISELRKNPEDKIFTVSGAYHLLKKQGVVADYHVECDYRDHKVNYLKVIDPRTKFLIESSVCSNYFVKVMEDVGEQNIIQWDISYEPWYTHPQGVFTFEPYGNVGAHAVQLAHHMGFRNFHIFGYDGSFFPDGRRHAGQTYLPPFGSNEDDITVIANGREWRTSPPFLMYTKKFVELLGKMQGCNIKMYGETLLTDWMKEVKRLSEQMEKANEAGSAAN